MPHTPMSPDGFSRVIRLVQDTDRSIGASRSDAAPGDGERVSGPRPAAQFAGLSAPRYTSYPTAADFRGDLDPELHESWLARVSPGEAVSIYLHVPYCREICHYCGCHTKAIRRAEPVEAYRDALREEIRLAAAVLPRRLPVARIAWGGGTPSILGANGIASIVSTLEAHFDLGALREHAIELDPRHVDASLARGLADIGIDRVSLGVQDLDPAVQAAIGRIQPERTVRDAVAVLRAAGISGINFDLMYGLPHQDETTIAATCRAVADLAPDRIACYGYAHLPARRANQRLVDAEALPGAEERLRQAALVARCLGARGYQPIGVDHFARMCDPLAVASRAGRLHRNFQGYTDDDRPTLLGFGASSISRFFQGFVQNAVDIAAYRRALERGALPTGRGLPLTRDDRDRGAIIEALLCDFRVDLSGQAGRFAEELARLRPYLADGLVTFDRGVLAVSRTGRPFARLVAQVFDAYRNGQGTGFSRVV
ncbi:oxygen-independent coproporphyrinogen III oxidase [Aureimonas sp. Leaf454]|uniref:oxygen-independent coproporphyrinogen III oxidase n=1 Tax=Aureimonas sp. Leaf454 TaxID=1736381 RepID=UPI001FCDAA39|nr:oxygen-independent coproporphyrinogen III oxidase [Aureimonas sp. Leaf454]